MLTCAPFETPKFELMRGNDAQAEKVVLKFSNAEDTANIMKKI
jgi:hypothetical protein